MRNRERDARFFDEFYLNYRVVMFGVPNREESAKRSEEEDGGKRRGERAKEERESMKQTKEK
jgi:hypothetical protein